jgi:aspartyl-tRNA(Asn)/glutamyl-tRNA(Gln) amidotransferase subunit A
MPGSRLNVKVGRRLAASLQAPGGQHGDTAAGTGSSPSLPCITRHRTDFRVSGKNLSETNPMSLPRGAGANLGLDLHAARTAVQARRLGAVELLDATLAAADGPAVRHAYIRRFDAQARAVAAAVDAALDSGAPPPPLAGLAVSVKDLFDVAGWPTTAGSLVLQGTAPATADAPVVARLRHAGAALVGHTNMSEFAFSGVGINPHFGTPANAATAALDATPCIPGGSSSGAAVSVASGAAWAALGSDTGGSIRIPAALHGLVGFKNTQRLTPLAGSVPLSTTLDTACAITRSVRDAVLLHEVLAARTVRLLRRPLSTLRLALPQTLMLDGLEPAVAAAFERAVARLRDRGARIDDLPLPQLGQRSTRTAVLPASKPGLGTATGWPATATATTRVSRCACAAAPVSARPTTST